jgi:putative acetyltransferase
LVFSFFAGSKHRWYYSMNQDIVQIVPVDSPKDLVQVRELFHEYAESLGFDLHFQDFDKEMAELPGDYAPPSGRLLLLIYESKIAGCVALRKMGEGVCEMKRLYLRPEFRGKGFGNRLARTIIQEARRMGYKFMRLDTVPAMRDAILLYRSLGFKDIEPYRYNPIEGAIFMELKLE